MTANALPLEFRLLAACCRWPHRPEHMEAVRAANDGVDWTLFLQLAKYHRVTALAVNGLQAAGVSPRADVLQQLTVQARASVLQSLTVAHDTIRLQEAFDRNAIPVLFLKGATLAIRSYGTLAVKHSRDIDVLTLPSSVGDALSLMGKLGYKLKPPFNRMNQTQVEHFVRYGRELPLQSTNDGLIVEIKWWPTANHTLLSGLSAMSPNQTIAIANSAAARTFDDAYLFAYLCAHGAVHRWSRLKWLSDLHALLATTPPDVVASWYRRASEIGAGACAAQALLLCDAVFGMPLPADLKPALFRWHPKHLAAAALRSMSCPAKADLAGDRIFGGKTTAPYSFRLGTSFRFLFEQFGKASVQALDAVFFRLPKQMYWLYPILRVPFFVLRKILRLHV